MSLPPGQYPIIVTLKKRANRRFWVCEYKNAPWRCLGRVEANCSTTRWRSCLGASLARAENESALRVLIQRFPDLRLAAQNQVSIEMVAHSQTGVSNRERELGVSSSALTPQFSRRSCQYRFDRSGKRLSKYQRA